MYLTIDVFISKAIFIHEITCTSKLSTLLPTIFAIGFTLWPKGGLVIYVSILCSERSHPQCYENKEKFYVTFQYYLIAYSKLQKKFSQQPQ